MAEYFLAYNNTLLYHFHLLNFYTAAEFLVYLESRTKNQQELKLLYTSVDYFEELNILCSVLDEIFTVFKVQIVTMIISLHCFVSKKKKN